MKPDFDASHLRRLLQVTEQAAKDLNDAQMELAKLTADYAKLKEGKAEADSVIKEARDCLNKHLH